MNRHYTDVIPVTVSNLLALLGKELMQICQRFYRAVLHNASLTCFLPFVRDAFWHKCGNVILWGFRYLHKVSGVCIGIGLQKNVFSTNLMF